MTPDRRSAEAGYTLVMLIMAIAIMAIMMGVAVQSVSFQMQREREAELIFRGKQYVEAIRLFRAKYGRYPMRMKEIWEADPHVIRKKFKDPITDSESWGVVFLGQERQRGGTQLAGGAVPTGTPTFGDEEESGRPGGRRNNDLPDGVRRDENGELIGPIVGVHSTSCDESIKVYEGRTTYCEWEFVLEDDNQRGGRGGRGGHGGGGGGPTGYHGGQDSSDFMTPKPRNTPVTLPTGTPRP